MKGMFFYKSCEYKLDLEGESWERGSVISGSLSLLPQGMPSKIPNLQIFLGFGNPKKIQNKDLSSFKMIDSIQVPEECYDKSVPFTFSFSLLNDFIISDNTKTLFVIIGTLEESIEVGLLPLSILPEKSICDFKDIFENFYKFKFKPFKNAKKQISSELIPPGSNEWVGIQKMHVFFEVESDVLLVEYKIKHKKMSYDINSIGTKDENLVLKSKLEKSDYSGHGSSPNQMGIKSSIELILDQLRTKSMR